MAVVCEEREEKKGIVPPEGLNEERRGGADDMQRGRSCFGFT